MRAAATSGTGIYVLTLPSVLYGVVVLAYLAFLNSELFGDVYERMIFGVRKTCVNVFGYHAWTCVVDVFNNVALSLQKITFRVVRILVEFQFEMSRIQDPRLLVLLFPRMCFIV